MGMNDRFLKETPQLAYHAGCLPTVVALTTTQTSETAAAAKDVAGSRLKLRPEDFKPGTAFRFTLGGTKSATNGAMKVHISLAGTQVISLTAPGNTAVDWHAVIVVAAKTTATQRCTGYFLSNAAAVVADYAAGTVNMKDGGIIKAQIENPHSSDTTTCEFCMVEMIRL